MFHSTSDPPPVPDLPESQPPRRPRLVHLVRGHVDDPWWWRWDDSDDGNDGDHDHFIGDNIPGVGGSDYPTKGQADLCALNPANPGCWRTKLNIVALEKFTWINKYKHFYSSIITHSQSIKWLHELLVCWSQWLCNRILFKNEIVWNYQKFSKNTILHFINIHCHWTKTCEKCTVFNMSYSIACILIGWIYFLRSTIGDRTNQTMIQVIISLQSDTTLHPVMIERCSLS